HGGLLRHPTRRHVEEPPPHPLEAALDSRPRLEPRRIEAIGWRELDGKANAAWHADRLLVEFAGGRPRHKSNANPAASTGQRMGQECARPPPSGPRGVRRGSGAPERRLRSPRASLQLRGDAARTSRAWGE